VAGLNPVDDAPGFRKAHIEPQPHYLLDRVKFRYNSAMGWYESSWEIRKRRFIWTVEIPFGAEAELVFPAGDIAKLTESHPELAFREKDGKVTATALSGRYHFDYVPTRPLHLVPSLDCTPAELMKIPGAKQIMLEAMPQLESKLADIEKMPPFPVRRILPRLGLSADMVAALDKKLAQLDA